MSKNSTHNNFSNLFSCQKGSPNTKIREEYKRDMQRHMQEKQTDLLIKQREAELVGLGLQQYRNVRFSIP